MRILRVRAQSKNNAQAGFTLFELLVVISIMAVLLGVTLPSLNLASNNDDFGKFEFMLKNSASEARYLSMITGKVQTMHFGSDGQVTITPSGLDEFDMPDGCELVLVETIDGSEDEDCKIVFYPSGLVEACVVQVRRDEDECSFYLSPISGIESRQGLISLGKFQE